MLESFIQVIGIKTSLILSIIIFILKVGLKDIPWGGYMKEAILYTTLSNQQVRCHVCPHNCKIAEGKRGLCQVRENREGTLYALNYGQTIALQVDPIEKKPLHRFMPNTFSYSLATMGCNMRCLWCQNAAIAWAPKQNGKLEGYTLDAAYHVNKALEYHCDSIAYTYTEPTIYVEYALDIMKKAHKHGLKNIWVSNGFATQATWETILPYLDAINIDIKAGNKQDYKHYCQGDYQPVLDTIAYLHHEKIHVEITVCIVPGINDDDETLTQIFKDLKTRVKSNTPLHLSRFFPAHRYNHRAKTSIETLHKAKQLALDIGFTDVILGNI